MLSKLRNVHLCNFLLILRSILILEEGVDMGHLTKKLQKNFKTKYADMKRAQNTQWFLRWLFENHENNANLLLACVSTYS